MVTGVSQGRWIMGRQWQEVAVSTASVEHPGTTIDHYSVNLNGDSGYGIWQGGFCRGEQLTDLTGSFMISVQAICYTICLLAVCLSSGVS